MRNIQQEKQSVVMLAPVSTSSAQTSDIINLKNALECELELVFTQAVSHQTVITLYESDDVSGSNTSQITETQQIWANDDIDTSDALDRETDAATYTLAAGTTNQHVRIRIDPAKLSEGYPCIYLTTSASSQATNFVSAVAHIKSRYPSDTTPPSAIID